MPAPQPVSTIEELLALPDDGLRHELLDGEHVVTPAPRLAHQAVVLELLVMLHDALRTHPHLRVFMSPADVRLGPRTLVQPDLFVIQQDPETPARDWPDIGVPILAIEVLSPTTASRDRLVKRRIYQQAEVAEYWIVDPDARLVERWTQGDDRPEIADGSLRWQPIAAVEVTVGLRDLFERAIGR